MIENCFIFENDDSLKSNCISKIKENCWKNIMYDVYKSIRYYRNS